MCTLQAVVVAVAAGRKGPVPARTWLAVAIAVIGIGCLELLPSVLAGGSNVPYKFCIGDIAALGQPIGFGLSYVVLEEVMQEYPEDELAISALQCVVIAAASLAAASAAFGSGALDLNALAAPWALFLSA